MRTGTVIQNPVILGLQGREVVCDYTANVAVECAQAERAGLVTFVAGLRHLCLTGQLGALRLIKDLEKARFLGKDESEPEFPGWYLVRAKLARAHDSKFDYSPAGFPAGVDVSLELAAQFTLRQLARFANLDEGRAACSDLFQTMSRRYLCRLGDYYAIAEARDSGEALFSGLAAFLTHWRLTEACFAGLHRGIGKHLPTLGEYLRGQRDTEGLGFGAYDWIYANLPADQKLNKPLDPLEVLNGALLLYEGPLKPEAQMDAICSACTTYGAVFTDAVEALLRY